MTHIQLKNSLTEATNTKNSSYPALIPDKSFTLSAFVFVAKYK